MSLQAQSREALLDAILQRSVADMRFRRALLVEPKRAIQEAFGIQIPPDFRIRFVEKGPDVDAMVVLPDAEDADAELSDEELEYVAGGAPTNYRWAPPPGTSRHGGSP
jgi:hypothetical protein